MHSAKQQYSPLPLDDPIWFAFRRALASCYRPVLAPGSIAILLVSALVALQKLPALHGLRRHHSCSPYPARHLPELAVWLVGPCITPYQIKCSSKQHNHLLRSAILFVFWCIIAAASAPPRFALTSVVAASNVARACATLRSATLKGFSLLGSGLL